MYKNFDEVFKKRNEMVNTFQLIDDIYLLDCVYCDFGGYTKEELFKLCNMVRDVWQNDKIGLSMSKISAMLYDFMKDNELCLDDAYSLYKEDFPKFTSYIITQYLLELSQREETEKFIDIMRKLIKQKNKKFKLF